MENQTPTYPEPRSAGDFLCPDPSVHKDLFRCPDPSVHDEMFSNLCPDGSLHGGKEPCQNHGAHRSGELPQPCLYEDAPPVLYAACLAIGLLYDLRFDEWRSAPSDMWRYLEDRGIVLTDEQVELLASYPEALDFLARSHTVTEADGTKTKFASVSLRVCSNHPDAWYPTTLTTGGCIASTDCKAKDVTRATRLKVQSPLATYRKPEWLRTKKAN